LDESRRLVRVGQAAFRHLSDRQDRCRSARHVAPVIRLEAMDLSTDHAYVTHREFVAGANRAIFQTLALGHLVRATRGLIRRVDRLRDLESAQGPNSGEPPAAVAMVK
jgi:hypothetical protein